jgi:hypothetical protein
LFFVFCFLFFVFSATSRIHAFIMEKMIIARIPAATQYDSASWRPSKKAPDEAGKHLNLPDNRFAHGCKAGTLPLGTADEGLLCRAHLQIPHKAANKRISPPSKAVPFGMRVAMLETRMRMRAAIVAAARGSRCEISIKRLTYVNRDRHKNKSRQGGGGTRRGDKKVGHIGLGKFQQNPPLDTTPTGPIFAGISPSGLSPLPARRLLLSTDH